MGLREEAIKQVYNGVEHPLEKIKTYAGSPNGAATADFPQQLCYDSTNNAWYQNHTDTTTWVAIY